MEKPIDFIAECEWCAKSLTSAQMNLCDIDGNVCPTCLCDDCVEEWEADKKQGKNSHIPIPWE